MSQRILDYGPLYEAERRAINHLWVCHECATLVQKPAGHTGIALCEAHK